MSMRFINRDTDYAARALCYMAKREKEEEGHVTTVSELVKHLQMPQPFLRKILQILNIEGVLTSRRGQGGGFRLARAPEKIYLTELIRIFQGPISFNECIFKRKVCPNRGECVLRRKMLQIEQHAVNQLKSINVAHLL